MCFGKRNQEFLESVNLLRRRKSDGTAHHNRNNVLIKILKLLKLLISQVQ